RSVNHRSWKWNITCPIGASRTERPVRDLLADVSMRAIYCSGSIGTYPHTLLSSLVFRLPFRVSRCIGLEGFFLFGPGTIGLLVCPCSGHALVLRCAGRPSGPHKQTPPSGAQATAPAPGGDDQFRPPPAPADHALHRPQPPCPDRLPFQPAPQVVGQFLAVCVPALGALG